MIPIKVLVPSGVLGLGFDLEALNNGVKNNPDIISIDGGSTDSGPYSLGSGTSKYSCAFELACVHVYTFKRLLSFVNNISICEDMCTRV